MKSLTLFLLFLASIAWAQDQTHQKSLQLFFGRSFHGTGDARGMEYGGIYTSDLSRKLFWFGEIGGSIHADEWPLYYSTPAGEWIDASIHYTTAGVQGAGGIGFIFLNRSRHRLSLRFGVVARYQSSSYWDYAEVIYPTITGLDFPVAHFINTTPKKTMSLGGRGSFSYSYLIGKSYIISLTASLQTDSNGDTLTSTSLGIGKKF